MDFDTFSNEELASTLEARSDLTELELVLLDRLIRALGAMQDQPA